MPAAGLEAFSRFPTMEREDGLRLMVENSLGEHGVSERPELVEEIFAYRLDRAPTLAGWQAQAAAGALFDAYDRAPRIAAPTLVLQGGADTVIDPRNAELLVELIPNAHARGVPDRGHLMVWEEGDVVADRERVPAVVTGRHTIGRWTSRPRPQHAGARRDRLRRPRSSPTASSTRRSDAFAAAFADAGLHRGDRVATLTGNSPEHVQVFFACAKAA